MNDNIDIFQSSVTCIWHPSAPRNRKGLFYTRACVPATDFVARLARMHYPRDKPASTADVCADETTLTTLNKKVRTDTFLYVREEEQKYMAVAARKGPSRPSISRGGASCTTGCSTLARGPAQSSRRTCQRRATQPRTTIMPRS